MLELLTGELRALDSLELEALVEILVLSAHADSEVSADEIAHLESSLTSLTDARVDAKKLIAEYSALLEQEGRTARLSALAAKLKTPASRRVALSMAIRLTAVDGIVRTSERELIAEAAEALGIEGDEAADMVKGLEPQV